MTLGFELELPSIPVFAAASTGEKRTLLKPIGLHDKQEIFRTADGNVAGVMEWGLNPSEESALLEIVTAPLLDERIDLESLATYFEPLEKLLRAFGYYEGVWSAKSEAARALKLEWLLPDCAFKPRVSAIDSDNVQVNFSFDLSELGRRIHRQRIGFRPSPGEEERIKLAEIEDAPRTKAWLDHKKLIFPPSLGNVQKLQRQEMEWVSKRVHDVIDARTLNNVVGFLWLALYVLRTETCDTILGHEKNRYCFLPRSSIYRLARLLDGIERQHALALWREIGVAIHEDVSFETGGSMMRHARDIRKYRPDLRENKIARIKLEEANNDAVVLFLDAVAHGLRPDDVVTKTTSTWSWASSFVYSGKEEENPYETFDITSVCDTKLVPASLKEKTEGRIRVVFEGRGPQPLGISTNDPVQDLMKQLTAWAEDAIPLDPPVRSSLHK